MKTGVIIGVSVLAVSAGGYVLYKMQVPPRFTVRNFSPTTMEGNFEWGKAAGPLQGGGGFSAGWGWDAKIIGDSNKQQYRVDVSKNGQTYKSIIIDGAGIYKL